MRQRPHTPQPPRLLNKVSLHRHAPTRPALYSLSPWEPSCPAHTCSLGLLGKHRRPVPGRRYQLTGSVALGVLLLHTVHDQLVVTVRLVLVGNVLFDRARVDAVLH